MRKSPVRRARPLTCEQLESRLVPSVTFPANSNVVDVRSYGALPNDGLDDTVAVQRALNDYMARDTILYFADGVYDFNAPLDYALAQRGERGLWLQGQSEAGTKLRWGANLPVFNRFDANNNPIHTVALDLYNGNNGNAFGNYIHDLSLEIGAGNAHAIGIQYQTNNYGSMRNVTIRSLDPNGMGVRGLDIIFNEPGPMLLENLTVEGFDQGVLAGPQSYSAVFEGLTLRNQRVYGFGNYRLPVSINNFTSVNTVPAYYQISSFGWGNTVITNAQFSGGDPGVFAVVNEGNGANGQGSAGSVFLRNVTTSGYRGVIDDQVANRQVTTSQVAEYSTQGVLSLDPASPRTSLNLPIEATPVTPEDPVANWVSVTDFGANPWDIADDSAAIQRAMDSGARTIYFPNPTRVNPTTGQIEGGSYRIGSTITVGGQVRRVAGLYSRLIVEAPLFGTEAPIFRVVDGNRDTVQFDGFQFDTEGGGGGAFYGFAQDTLTHVILKDGVGGSYRNGVRGGKVFIENWTMTDLRFTGQQAWLRQINPEETVNRAKIVNDGGDLWILGLKTEGRSTQVETRNGGRTEVLGGQIYTSWYVPGDYPAFTSTDSSLSFSVAESSYSYSGRFNTWVRETRNGVMRDMTLQNTPIDGSRLGAATIGLYSSRIVDTTAPGIVSNLRATSSLSSVTLSWDAAPDAESQVRAYRVYRDGTYIGATAMTTFVDTNRPDGAAGVYSVVAENAAGLQGPASAPLLASTTADTTIPTLLLARTTPYRSTQVILTFSEPLAVTQASNPGNYTIDNGAVVSAATLSADGRTVTLTTNPLTDGTEYTVSVNNLRDRSTAGNLLPQGSAAAFGFRASARGTGLTGSYFPSNNFTGTPEVRLDPKVDYDWGYGSPGVPGIGADNFSVRWTGQIEPRFSETYTFIVSGDDGLRLSIDGNTLIDRPYYSPSEWSASIRLEAGQRYDLEFTMFEYGGGAGARLWWQSPSQAREIVPPSQLFPTPELSTVTVRTGFGRGADSQYQIIDQGLRGDYFANPTFSGTPTLTRTDGSINFFWNGSPASGIPADNFSVRWTGYVLPAFTEDYTFSALPDDVFRLWVNDQLILDRQSWSSTEVDSAAIRLQAGVPATIRIDYVETGGPGTAVLLWRSPSTIKNFPAFLQPSWDDSGANDVVFTSNRLNFSFAAEMIGLKFDLSGVDLTNNRIVDSGFYATLGRISSAGITPDILFGTNDNQPNADWAESGPNRLRWTTFPGNRGGNYAYGGPGISTYLGPLDIDNTNYQLNFAGRDGIRFRSDALTSFLQADTDRLVSLFVKRRVPDYYGQISFVTKESGDGSNAPALRLTLAPKSTPVPTLVDLLPTFDTGASVDDNRTSLTNGDPGQALRFAVSGTLVGALVTLYADGVALGSAVATGATTQVLTAGNLRLLEGARSITARQTWYGVESADSAPLTVTLDSTAPTAAIASVSPILRNMAVDRIAISFSEPVVGFDLSDLSLAYNGSPVSLTSATLTGRDAAYWLEGLPGLTGAEGAYGLTLSAANSGISDLSGNLLPRDSSTNWTVDLTAPVPSLTSITPALRNSPVSTISLTFSEPVVGLDVSDFTLTRDGNAVSLSLATLTANGANYQLGNLDSVTGTEGIYSLSLNPLNSGITDQAGNALVAGATTGWTTDTTAPVAQIASVTPDPRSTPVDSLPITFSEPVTGFGMGAIVLTWNGALVSLAGATLTGSGASYTLHGLTAATAPSGNYTLRIQASGSGISDAAGNGLLSDAVENWIVTDRLVPRVQTVRRLDANPTNADTVRFEVSFTELVTGVDTSDFDFRYTGGLNEADVLSVTGTGSVYIVTTTTGLGNGTLRLDLLDDDTIRDASGNRLGGTGLSNGSFRKGESYTIDRIAPRVTSISGLGSSTRRTPVDSLMITFSEAISPTSFGPADLTLTRNAGANLIVPGGPVTITPTGTRTFRIDGLTTLTASSGTYVFTLDATGVTDLANNAGTNTLERSWSRESPRVLTITRTSANPTNASSVTYTVTFSEPVSGVDAADFAVSTSGLTGVVVTNVVSLTPSTYQVSVATGTGSGTLRLDLIHNETIRDLYNNSLAGDYTRGQIFTIDRTPPEVRSITGVSSRTTSSVACLTVNFSEMIDPVTFTLANLVLTRNGVRLSLGSRVTITALGGRSFRIEGLEDLTSDPGLYSFSVNMADIRDLAGNTGVGSRTLSWTKMC